MKKSFCFIVNTSSNKGRAGSYFADHRSLVTSRFGNCTIKMVTKGQCIDKYAAKAARDNKYIVAVGGDGTARQVAIGIAGTEACLGVLPMGSGNDFAKSVGMDRPFDDALEKLQQQQVEHIDVIETGDDLVLNTFGIGIDGLTNYYAQTSSIPNGSCRYFYSAVRALFGSNVWDYKCVIDGDRMEGRSWMIVVANGATEGGRYKISPASNNTDGTVEVVIVRDLPLVRLLPEFMKLSAGIPFDEQVVTKIPCRESLSITLDSRCYAHSDGEIVPPTNCFRFRIQKQALPVITGTKP